MVVGRITIEVPPKAVSSSAEFAFSSSNISTAGPAFVDNETQLGGKCATGWVRTRPKISATYFVN